MADTSNPKSSNSRRLIYVPPINQVFSQKPNQYQDHWVKEVGAICKKFSPELKNQLYKVGVTWDNYSNFLHDAGEFVFYRAYHQEAEIIKMFQPYFKLTPKQPDSQSVVESVKKMVDFTDNRIDQEWRRGYDLQVPLDENAAKVMMDVHPTIYESTNTLLKYIHVHIYQDVHLLSTTLGVMFANHEYVQETKKSQRTNTKS